MRLDTGDPDDGGINLTPLIDVVFLLLIFFLTATTFSREEVEMDLELPEAASGEPAAGDQTIVINIGRDGRLVMNGRGVTEEALHQKLRAAAARDKDRQVLIRGDTEARYGLVAKVLDACLVAKLHSISIGAIPHPDNKGR
ncbi:MAG: ExbD/TolR family protein [Planctomycetota bacterium]